jgi:hypothetical protein
MTGSNYLLFYQFARNDLARRLHIIPGAGQSRPATTPVETGQGNKEMPQNLEIPDKNQANMKQVEIDVSAGKGDDKVETKFAAELPATLEDAIAAFGKKEVFRRFINAHVVYLQSQKRNELTKETQERERKRAPYLESLGL